jgi:hypothetical protein
MEALNERDCVRGNSVGRRIIFPSTFLGGDRHMHQLYQDAMSIRMQYQDLHVTPIGQ